MDFDEAKSILNFLANGINPISGEVLPEISPYNEPKVIRALFTVLGSSKSKTSPKKTSEEKQQENILSGRPKNAGLPWTDNLKKELEEKYMSGVAIEELILYFERTKGSIIAELLKQGLIEKAVAETMR